jgi:hypothetical protein
MGRVAHTPLAAVGLLTPAPRSAGTTAHDRSSACENVFLTFYELGRQARDLSSTETSIGRSATLDRVAAAKFAASGQLRSVTESAKRAAKAVERLVGRASAEALWNGCVLGTHEGHPSS